MSDEELGAVRQRLQKAIDAITDLSMDYAAVVIAKDRAERERAALERTIAMDRALRLRTALERNRAGWREPEGYPPVQVPENAGKHQAVVLIEYALHLRQHGERAPGGNETWAKFDQMAENYLRMAEDHLRTLHRPTAAAASKLPPAP